jgi:hypothetical protein
VRAWRALFGAGGLTVLAVGVAGVVRHSAQTRPSEWGTYLVGGLLAHDAVIAPVTAVVSWLLVRLLPARVRPAVMAGLFVSASLALVAIPVVGGYGRLANNPSILPSHHYARALLVAVGSVWLLVVAGLTRPWRGLRRPIHLPRWPRAG